MKKIYFFLLLTVLFLSGCGLLVAPEVKEFDLRVNRDSIPGTVRVAAVRNLSNSGQRFLLRADNELTRDPYNLWTAEPGTLICNALNRIFKENKTLPAQLYICDVDCFETDVEQSTFRLSGSFRKQGTARRHRFDITVPVEEQSAEYIVSAASSAVEKLAGILSGTAKK